MEIGRKSQRAFQADIAPADLSSLAASFPFIPWFNTWSTGAQNDEALRMMEFVSRSSPTYGAMIALKAHYLFGQGLWADPAVNKNSARAIKRFNDWYTTRNAMGNLPSEEIGRTVIDYCEFGHLFMQFSRISEGGAGWFELFHQQSWNTRLSRPNPSGVVESVKISQNFLNRTRQQNAPPGMSEIPLYKFGSDEGKDMGNGFNVSMIQIKDYQPGFEWYGVPSCVMAIPDAFLEYTCNASWQQLAKTGFSPSIIAQFIDKPGEPDELIKFNRMMRDEFSGADNFGKPLIQVLTNKDEFANIFTVKPEYPTDYIQLKEQCRDSIILAHRVPVALASVQTAGKLGSNREIRDAYNLYYSTVVKPAADKIARELTEILYPYFGLELSFRQNPPVDDYIPMTNNMFLESRGLPLLPPELGNLLYVAQ